MTNPHLFLMDPLSVSILAMTNPLRVLMPCLAMIYLVQLAMSTYKNLPFHLQSIFEDTFFIGYIIANYKTSL
jgi:hypothetical protein